MLLKSQYIGIINQIEQDFIKDAGIIEVNLAAKEASLLAFGLNSYKQKPQIAISYKSGSKPAQFFFKGITDEESQKQILIPSSAL